MNFHRAFGAMKGEPTPDCISRAEKRVVSAAMRLADMGHGFVFKDNEKIASVKQAKILEAACGKLRDLRRAL